MHRLSFLSQSRNNNFNLIRLICAVGVLLAHSHLVFTGSSLPWYMLGVRLDHMFVAVFFVISGFLICRSLVRSQDLRQYFLSRAIRLLPALAVLLLITVFIIGPLATDYPLSIYFTDPSTWRYFLNLNLFSIDTQFDLADVFSDNPYPQKINASLWTLPIEVWLYSMVATLFCIALLLQDACPPLFEKARQSTVLWGLFAVLLGSNSVINTLLSDRQDDSKTILLFICLFAIAALCYLARDYLVLRYRYAGLLWMGVVALLDTPILSAYVCICITYSVLVLAYRPGGFIRQFNQFGDYSYGLYIYGFVVQQMTLQLWPNIGFSLFVMVSTIATFGAAALSWHWIEQPCLKRL